MSTETPSHKDTKSPSAQPPTTPWWAWPFVALKHGLFIWMLLCLIEWSGVLGEVGAHAKNLLEHQLHNGADDGLAYQWVSQLIQTLLALLLVPFHGGFSGIEPYWQGMILVTLGLLLRMIGMITLYPLFLLVLLLAVIDGLVIRQKRTAEVARETETVHYYAKRSLSWAAILTGYAWLLLPGLVALPMGWICLPGLALMGITLQHLIASYKKYL